MGLSNLMPGQAPDDGPIYGHETALWQDMKAIEARFAAWLLAAKKNSEFWSPEDEAKADDIANLFDELSTQMYGKL